MYKIELGKSGLLVPTVAVGCMRISDMNEKEASAFVETALSNGANFFDHADIYGGGKSETVFGKAISPSMRDDVIIQTKCGIRQGRFDFSYEHITESVNGSLKGSERIILTCFCSTAPTHCASPRRLQEPLTSSKHRARCGISAFPTRIRIRFSFCSPALICLFA